MILILYFIIRKSRLQIKSYMTFSVSTFILQVQCLTSMFFIASSFWFHICKKYLLTVKKAETTKNNSFSFLQYHNYGLLSLPWSLTWDVNTGRINIGHIVIWCTVILLGLSETKLFKHIRDNFFIQGKQFGFWWRRCFF